MKKVILSFLAVIMLAGCVGGPKKVSYQTVTITNPITMTIKNEHPDLSGYIFLEDKEPAFIEITMKEAIRLFKEKGSGVLVFSSDNCPWCERAIPELDYVAKQMGIKVYFVNPYAPYNFPDTKERHKDFARICEYLKPIMKKDENGQEQFYIPQVVAIKNGEIVGDHLSLVDGVESDENGPIMTEEQVQELRGEYKKLIAAAAD